MLGAAILQINALQRALQQDVAVAIRDMGLAPGATLAAVALALGLGMVHALTPGHGKAVVFSYFLGQRSTVARGVLIAAKIALVHGATATILVLAFGAAVSSFGRPAALAAWLQVASYAAVSVIGAFYLWRALKPPGAAGQALARASAGAILPAAVGLLPCPLTMTIVSFAVSQTSLARGLVMAALVAVGGAMTISSFGLAGMALRSGLLRWLDPNGRRYRQVVNGLEIASSIMILALGVLLLLGSVATIA